MAPGVKDMKALATALKMAGAFESVDRLAHDWIERGMREKKAEDFEEAGERREWYELRDGWERAIDALKKKVNKFQEETGYSPILRYWRQADSMGQIGKVYLGYDSAQAKGYRIIEIRSPVWFEELNLQTEEMKEEDIYKLVPLPARLTATQEDILRETFRDELKEAGVETFEVKAGVLSASAQAYWNRFNGVIDRRRTYNENVFRVDDLAKAIIREHALVVAKPAGGPIVPVIGPRETPLARAPEAPKRREIPSELKVKLHVEEGMNLGEYEVHVFYDSFEVTFFVSLSTQALKDYLEEKEDYYDAREMLSFQELSEAQVEAELKKMPWPFSAGVEIKLVWTPGDIDFTPKAKEWWEMFNKTYTRSELGAFDIERLKTIAKLKGVKVGKDKDETMVNILGEAALKLPTTELLLDLISAIEPVEEDILKAQIKNSGYDAYSVDGERAFRAALGELLRSGKVFEPRPGWYRRTEKPEVVEAMKKAAAETKAKLEEFEQLKKLGGVPPSAPPTAAPAPPAKPRPLTRDEISKLQDVYSDHLFRQLGRVPPNAMATFRVEIDKVKDKSYAEAQDHILGIAGDIVGAFVAKEGIERITPARRFEAPERPEEGVVMGRTPPAQPPKEPLEPETMRFPRAPSRKEKEQFWNAFRYRLQEQGFNAFDFVDQFEEYIEKSQFYSWKDLLEKYEDFTKSIMEGKPLPPLWSWRGAPIPIGLEGVIRKTPAERLDDLIVHFTSVVIRNGRSRGCEAMLGDLQKELEERGIIPSDMIITPTSPLFAEIRNAIMDAYKRKDDWFNTISLEELTRFLET